MSFNISDFFLKDIIYTAKGNLENKFFKVTIDNVEYPALISRVASSLITISVYSRRKQIDYENPIEKGINEFNNNRKEEGSDYFFEKYGSAWDVDFLDSEKFFLHPSLYYLFEEHIFEFTDINERTNDFLTSKMEEYDMIFLSSAEIVFKDLDNSSSDFDTKFRKFIHEKCIKEYNDNTDLQNALIEVNKKRIEYEKEKEKRMQVVREKERKIQEFNDNLDIPKRKNLKDYNIR